jgi:hypothetical protein
MEWGGEGEPRTTESDLARLLGGREIGAGIFVLLKDAIPADSQTYLSYPTSVKLKSFGLQ